MAGEEDAELRDLVTQTLENKGVLGKIRVSLAFGFGLSGRSVALCISKFLDASGSTSIKTYARCICRPSCEQACL